MSRKKLPFNFNADKLNLQKALSFCLVLLFCFNVAQAQFTGGNIVAVQVGTGAAALASSSTAFSLKEFTPAGVAAFSVTIPTTGVGSRLCLSGTATSEGLISRSADFSKIIIAGYDTAPGLASVASSTSANVNRAIAVVDANGNYSRPVFSTTFFSANNIRGATASGSNYWGSGSNQGINYFGTGTATLVSNTITSTRAIGVYNGQLYFSTGSGTTGIYAVGSGTPITTGQTSTNVINTTVGASPSPYQFVFNSAGTICYIADDRTIANGGGIQKWVFTTGWSLAYTLATGSGSTVGARGLAVDFSGANPVVYATTTETLNRIIKITDTGAGSVATTIVTAPTNTAFRGLVLSPVTCSSASISGVVVNTCPATLNGSIDLTATGGTPPLTYLWSDNSTNEDISSLAAGTYTVTVSGGGCTASSSFVVGNLSAPTPIISGATSFCPGSSTTLDAGSHTLYQWSTGATTQSIVVSSAATFTVSVSDGGGCSGSASVTTSNFTAPSPAITGNLTICPGSSTSLNAGAGFTTYLWSNSETTQSISANAGGTYTVTVANGNGCTGSSNATVIVAASLNPTITGTLQFCAGNSTTLSTQVYSSYLWSTSETTQSISVNTQSSFTVTVTDAGGCTGSVSASVIQNPLPAPSITGTLFACFGSNASLDAGSYSSYLWSNAATTQVINTNTSGIYSVTVTNGFGCSASASASASISNQINVSFVVSNPSYCSGGSSTITASGADTYSWTPSTGLNATTGTSITANPTSTIIYTVTATNANLCTQTATVTINVTPAPVITGSITSATCTGISNGAININVSGGTPCGSNSKPLLISKIFANPGGSDFSLEFAELIATKFIDFSVTPYTLIVANNGSGTVNGWKAGGGITYAFQISTGTASPGTVYYVGGKDMIPTINHLRVLDITTTGGDGGLGNSQATAGVFGNGGANADGVAIFQGTVASITSSSVPEDAVFYGTGIGTALVTGGTAGYQLPVNDFYAGGKLQSTSYFGPDALSDSLTVLSGTYNTATNIFTTPRTIVRMSIGTLVQGTSLITLAGAAPYTFTWSTGATTQNLSGIISGIYTVTATDCNGCSTSASFTVGSQQSLTVSGSSTNANCHGEASGTATVNPSVGTAPYSYSWSDGTTSQTAINLAAGTYTVVVTDINGCSNSLSKTITQPQSSIALSVTKEDELCAGDLIGAIDVTASGGTPCGVGIPGLVISKIFTNPAGNDSPFEFAELLAVKDIDFSVTPYTVIFANNGSGTSAGWKAGGVLTYAFEINTGIAVAGNVYSVGGDFMNPTFNRLRTRNTSTQTGDGGIGTPALSGVLGNGGGNADAVGVFKSTVAALDSNTVPEDAVFFGAAPGGSVVAGGSLGFQLPVNDLYHGGKLNTLSFVAPDIISDQVIVANGTFSIATNGFATPRTFTLSSILLFNEAETNITFVNGTPYTYTWSNGATSEDLTGIAAGTYTVTVMDCNGCTKTISATVAEPLSLNIASVVNNVTCYNTATANINITVTGGTSPYTYVWNNGSTAEDRSNLKAGTYSVTITDGHGCMQSQTFVITQPSSTLLLNAAKTNIRCGNYATGEITCLPVGGMSPYTYVWSNSLTTQTISLLPQGTYTVTVTDAAGCVKTKIVSITQNPPLIVLVSPVSPSSANAAATGGVPPYVYLWNTVPNQSTATATGLTPGMTYKVKVTDSKGCTKISSYSIPLPKISAADSKALDIVLYPNPTNGIVNLRFENSMIKSCYLKVTTITSQIIYLNTESVDAGNIQKDFSELPKGIYFIKVSTSDFEKTLKLVIQ